MPFPPLSEEITKLHIEACLKGDDGYIDPKTTYFVMTSIGLWRQGQCCGNGCRHCPYDEHTQREAERPQVPSYPFLDFTI